MNDFPQSSQNAAYGRFFAPQFWQYFSLKGFPQSLQNAAYGRFFAPQFWQYFSLSMARSGAGSSVVVPMEDVPPSDAGADISAGGDASAVFPEATTGAAARLDGLAASTTAELTAELTAEPFSRTRRTNARGGDASAVFPEATTGAAARLDGLAASTTAEPFLLNRRTNR